MRIIPLLLVVALLIAIAFVEPRTTFPPLWTVPGQKVRHVKTKEVGVIREAGSKIVVDFPDRSIECEPIEVVPIN